MWISVCLCVGGGGGDWLDFPHESVIIGEQVRLHQPGQELGCSS